MALPALVVPAAIGLGKLIAGSIATDLTFKAAFKGIDMYASHKETQYYKELSKKRVEAGEHKYVPKHLETAGMESSQQASSGLSSMFNSLGGIGGIASSIFNVARIAVPVIGGGIALMKGLLGRKRKRKEQRRQQAMMRENASRAVMMNPAFAGAFPQHGVAKEVTAPKKRIAKEKAKSTPAQLTRSGEFTNSDGTRKGRNNHSEVVT